MIECKSAWVTGMLIKPQHFQQQERYAEYVQHEKLSMLQFCNWGLAELAFDYDALLANKVSIVSVCGVFSEGTFFKYHSTTDHPLVIELTQENATQYVYLCIPRLTYSNLQVQDEGLTIPHRYTLKTHKIRDYLSNNGEVDDIGVAQLNISLQIDTDNKDNYYYFPIVKIKAFSEEKGLILDQNFLPPCINIFACQDFAQFIQSAMSMLRRKQLQLTKLLGHEGSSGVAVNVSDMDRLLLQIINKYIVQFHSYNEIKSCHPFQLYQLLMTCTAELATYLHKEHHLEVLHSYKHKEPLKTFEPMMQQMRGLLSTHIDKAAVVLEKQVINSGLFKFFLPSGASNEKGRFILAIKLDASPEQTHQILCQQVKIASPTQIDKVVRLQLSGLKMQPLNVAPGSVPFDKHAAYFELDERDELWVEIVQVQEMSLYLTKNYDAIEIVCWFIPVAS